MVLSGHAKRPSPHDSKDTNDEALLAKLGYKQEFKRDFSRLELFGLSLSIVGIVQSITAVLLYSTPYGGPAAMIWGWFTCCCFLIVVALAMAELGSAAPTSGGLYYWTFQFSPPRYRKLLSWLIGYVNTAAYIAGLASVDWGAATQIMAAANIGTDGRFVATNAQVYGLFCGLLILHAVMASMATKVIARLQHFFIFLNIALFIIAIVVLPASTPRALHNTPAYAFGHFENVSGWSNGYAFILSFLAPAWTVAGFDTSVHISEEARNAPRAVPFAILSATILSSILGWIVNIVVALYIGSDLKSVIGNPIGQPMATIFFNSVGKQGTLAIWTLIVITLWMTGMDYATNGRLTPTLRIRTRPRPPLFRDPYTKTPVNAVFFLAIMSLLLGLISFAGPIAISAVFTMSVVCQYIGFVAPIILRWVGGREFEPGPFHLGRLSAPISFVASAYMMFMIIVFLCPATPAPTSRSMNYTVVVVGGTLALSLGYYFFPRYGGMYWFKGPVETIHDRAEREVVHDRGDNNEKGSAGEATEYTIRAEPR